MHESVGEGEDRHLVLERCSETAMYVELHLKHIFLVYLLVLVFYAFSKAICIAFYMEPPSGAAVPYPSGRERQPCPPPQIKKIKKNICRNMLNLVMALF